MIKYLQKSPAILKGTVLTMLAFLFQSCEQKDLLLPEPGNGIYFAPVSANQIINQKAVIPGIPSEITISAALYKVADKTMSVTIMRNDKLIDDYNKLHETNYVPLPEGAINFDVNTVVSIEKGKKASTPFKIEINTEILEAGVSYFLPLEIVSVAGSDNIVLSAAFNKTYYAILPGAPQNIAVGKPSQQSSIPSWGAAQTSDKAVNGDTTGTWSGRYAHTFNDTPEQWWEVDLQAVSPFISSIKLYNITDNADNASRFPLLRDVHVFVSDVPFKSTTIAGTQAQEGVSDYFVEGEIGQSKKITIKRSGRYVRVQLAGPQRYLCLAEVEVYGAN